jgi:hypothetical protein
MKFSMELLITAAERRLVLPPRGVETPTAQNHRIPRDGVELVIDEALIKHASCQAHPNHD